jgi:hypothetical protein
VLKADVSHPDRFPTEWSLPVGLLLGYVLGNGTVGKWPYPTVSIVSGEADEADLYRLNDHVRGWCDSASHVAKIHPAPNAIAADPKPTYNIAWRVSALARFLSDLGLDKSIAPELRRAPSQIWTANREGVRGFLSGMFSTDGSVTLTHNDKIEVSLAAVSRPLLQDVQQLLASFGIRSTLCAYAKSNIWRAAEGYRSLWKLGINSIGAVRQFASVIGFFNERKQKRLIEALELRPARKSRNDSPFVAEIEELPEAEEVFDLVNVGDERQFLANGLIVSNCYALKGNYNYPSKQVNDMIHGAWVAQELREGGPQRLGQALAYAIQHINISRPQGFQPYFRIHDAGDFYSEEYLEAWVVCASMMTHMRFWAPTRQWVFKKWVPLLQSAEQRVRSAGGHLVIRPSVLRFHDPVPMIGGLAAGSGVSAEEREPCVWVCPVYNKLVPRAQPDGSILMEEAVSCIEAQCTMCWDQPGVPVSYGGH